MRGVQGEVGAVVTARTLEFGCRGSHSSPASYSFMTLDKSALFPLSFSFVTCEVRMIVEPASQLL